MLKVRDVVRDVVAEHAKHELPLVDSLRRFDDDRVIRTLTRQGHRREPLGFGYAEVAALITPVIWLVLDQAARRGVDMATDSLATRGRARLRRLLRRAPAAPERVLITLQAEELALVRTHILERAVERGIDRREAEALADSVVARIATAAHQEEPDAPDTVS
ncbi:hypothetical protein FCH28_29810 [Streptomyces piniterrae]|uniref:Uncharacterized protein n=1 Tax=Streptomyces piniterrae TaxID=2571125 RepID=A0A4U0MUZ0_9ACTN|nr:hypothetical protein [Streptomyces piniterrae]TJZ44536.1 hypothetical protein FCH28_29810 [Streptomyces piniterrae]